MKFSKVVLLFKIKKNTFISEQKLILIVLVLVFLKSVSIVNGLNVVTQNSFCHFHINSRTKNSNMTVARFCIDPPASIESLELKPLG